MVANHKFFIFAFRTENVLSQQIHTTMKKLLTILTFALVAFSAKAQSCPDDNHPHMIDLGLPSGAKWACCNVGADKPEDCGGYYAWGETEEKFNYSPASYKYAYEVEDSNAYHHWDKKYYEFTEIGEDIACTQYDVANVTWGEEWQMPNLLRYEELGKNCSFEWGTINGIKGGLFTGPNGNSIFLPAAGYCNEDKTWYNNNGIYHGWYWSSAAYGDSELSVCYHVDSIIGSLFCNGRYFGYSVRPIACGFEDSLILSFSNLNLFIGLKKTVDIIWGFGIYTVDSDDETVATATLQGNSVTVTAISAGSTIITVTDIKSSKTATIEVTVEEPITHCPDDNHPHAIDLGLPSGTKWACCNVSASVPEDYGGYFAWGETEEKDIYDWSTYIHCDGNNDTLHDIGSDIANTQYDVAHIQWGGNWQMPSRKQFQELFDNCAYLWTTKNDISGGQFTGPSGNTIFLPSSGVRLFDDLYYDNTYGFYWLSEHMPIISAWGYVWNLGAAFVLGVSSSESSGGTLEYFSGITIRPVIIGTTKINLPKPSEVHSVQSVYNIYGIKVADSIEKASNLPPGIYIVNGKKIVIK